jgi:alpha-beta hydrolase superfamily lysophospholipase
VDNNVTASPLTAAPKKPSRRRRWLRRIGVLLALGFVLLNLIAYLQARAMTRFATSGEPLQALVGRPWYERWWVAATGVQVPRPENHSTPAALGLPYETRLLPLPGGEQLEDWWIPRERSRGIVLMLPGYAQPKESLLAPAATVRGWGYSSFLLDFRGAGGSSGADTTLGLREAQDVLAAARYIEAQWPGQPLIVYGLSMGGTAALRAVALEGLRPAALIVEGPFDRLLTTVRHRFTALGLPAFPSAELLLFWGGQQMGYDGFAHNPVEYAPRVECPVLILYGQRDPWLRPEEIDAVARAMGGPVEVVAVPGAGHEMPFAMGASELWAVHVRPFLERAGTP